MSERPEPQLVHRKLTQQNKDFVALEGNICYTIITGLAQVALGLAVDKLW